MLKAAAIQAASAIARPLCRGVGCILALHRVVPEAGRSRFPENGALELTPEGLRGILGWVRKRGLEPIALDALPERLAAPRKPTFICFTLDDGCSDTLHQALPIFREFDVPFTVNITNGFASGTISVWWYLLEDVLTAEGPLRFRWQGRDFDFPTDTPQAKLSAFDDLASMIRSLGTERDELIQRLAEASGVDPLDPTRRTSMTWDEVRKLAAEPLVTIGAHTRGHHSLNRLTDAEIIAEVHEARQELEAQIGREVRHFAYPFGGRSAVNEREFALVRSSGFTTMVTTRSANLFAGHANLTDRLPRLSIGGNSSAVKRLQILESGLLSMLKRGFKRVVGE